MSQTKLKYPRVMLKVSGQGFCKEDGQGIDGEELVTMAAEIADVARLGVQLAVVVGGGNFIRGTAVSTQIRVQEATAHYMGMLATVINALALQDTLEAVSYTHLTLPTIYSV